MVTNALKLSLKMLEKYRSASQGHPQKDTLLELTGGEESNQM